MYLSTLICRSNTCIEAGVAAGALLQPIPGSWQVQSPVRRAQVDICSKALNTMKTLESRKDHFREFAPDFSASPQMMFGICAAPAAIAGAKNLDASMGGETLHSCCQHCQHGFFHAQERQLFARHLSLDVMDVSHKAGMLLLPHSPRWLAHADGESIAACGLHGDSQTLAMASLKV